MGVTMRKPMTVETFLDLARSMVSEYFKRYVKVYDENRNIIELQNITIRNLEMDSEGWYSVDMLVNNGCDNTIYTVEYSPWADEDKRISSYRTPYYYE